MNVYIIGTGVMGSAIAKALAKKDQRVFVYDRSFAKSKILAKQKNIQADKSFENLGKADFVIAAVKPQDMAVMASGIRGMIKPSAVIISIAAGLQIAKIQKLFRHKKVLRIMPNLGLAVGQGIAVWKSGGLNTKEKGSAKKLLIYFTENFEVKNEAEIDKGSVIYGCGPAYFFLLAHALEQAALGLGINKEQSRKMVEKTFSASAILQLGQDYQSLISRVASKKGITEAALKVFEKKEFKKIVKEAIGAGIKRTKELANG